RETRRRSYVGNVSGYSLRRLQGAHHPDHGLASSLSRAPRAGRLALRREPWLTSSRVPRQGSSPASFRSRDRVSPTERSQGPELYGGKLSRPVLRGLAPNNRGWLPGDAC